MINQWDYLPIRRRVEKGRYALALSRQQLLASSPECGIAARIHCRRRYYFKQSRLDALAEAQDAQTRDKPKVRCCCLRPVPDGSPLRFRSVALIQTSYLVLCSVVAFIHCLVQHKEPKEPCQPSSLPSPLPPPLLPPQCEAGRRLSFLFCP